MKSFITHAVLAASTIALSTAAPAADAGWKEIIPASDFQLYRNDSFTEWITAMDKALPNQKVDDIMKDLNHPTTFTAPLNIPNFQESYSWDAVVGGFNDRTTKDWYPQGITTSSDALQVGTYKGFDITLVSWHSATEGEKRGARISFLSPEKTANNRIKYRHVLLVQPKSGKGSEADFTGITKLHAGGIAWYGDHLYVAETHGGLRVFDLRKIYQVDTSEGSHDNVGKQGSKFQAYGYKYILPQVRAYTPAHKNGKKINFSFVSIDRGTVPDSLLMGEWQPTAPTSKLLRFNLSASSDHDFALQNNHAVAYQAIQHPFQQIQGAISIEDRYFFTQSWNPNGHLIAWDGNIKSPVVNNYSCALGKGPVLKVNFVKSLDLLPNKN